MGSDRGRSGGPRDHLLLTVLGIRPKTAVYSLGDERCEANLSPLALLELLEPEDRPRRVLAICTPEAMEQSWPTLRSGLNGGPPAAPVLVPNTGNPADIGDFLSAVADRMPANVDLTVDITHGFRHYSFLIYVAVLYLAALRSIRVRGVYYGLLQRAPAASPFMNLGDLLQLQKLIHAVRTLRDTGSATALASLWGAETNDNPASGLAGSSSYSNDWVSDLVALSEAHGAGLPLEYGNLAHSVLEKARRRQAGSERRQAEREDLDRSGAGREVVAKSFSSANLLDAFFSRDEGLSLGSLPASLIQELRVQFEEILEPFELRAGTYWKGKVALDRSELERQARVIDYQLRCRNTAAAIGMMHEWAVSWCAWCRNDEKGWLQYNDSRRRATAALKKVTPNSCGAEAGQCSCDAPLKCRLAKFWCDLTTLRNATHHHGMSEHDLLDSDDRQDKLAFVLEYWNGILKACPDYGDLLEPMVATGKRVLVSPVGMTPGVLLTALAACRQDDYMGEPSSCIVVCSNESKAVVNEALQTHGKYEGEIRTLIFQDPQAGISEIAEMATSAHQLLEDAEEVVVNITGGTTLMGVAVEKIASNAQKAAGSSSGSRSRVRRIGLVDRRPREQQESDPYVVGDVIWIDDTGE